MTEHKLIKLDDALATAGVIYKWSIAAAEELEAAIAALPAIDPAAIPALQARIEELVKEKTALNHLCNAIFNRHIKEINELEAKLTKAVEALRESVKEFDCPIARAALAELEGK